VARMVRKQLYIDERQDAVLKAAAESTGQTESALIRRAIDLAYDESAAAEERMRRHEEFNRTADAFAAALAAAGESVTWPTGNRESLYRRGSHG
jgi:hypothetical protein